MCSPGRGGLVHLLIAAAGSGRRMGAEGNKLLLPVAGRPVLAWTLDAALACPLIRGIGIVGQPVDAVPVAAIVAAAGADRPVAWIEGGDTRQESVRRGLAALPPDARGATVAGRQNHRCACIVFCASPRAAPDRLSTASASLACCSAMSRASSSAAKASSEATNMAGV